MVFSLSKSNSMSSALSQHSIYYVCVTIMSFLVAFENLAIVSSYDGHHWQYDLFRAFLRFSIIYCVHN